MHRFSLKSVVDVQLRQPFAVYLELVADIAKRCDASALFEKRKRAASVCSVSERMVLKIQKPIKKRLFGFQFSASPELSEPFVHEHSTAGCEKQKWNGASRLFLPSAEGFRTAGHCLPSASGTASGLFSGCPALLISDMIRSKQNRRAFIFRRSARIRL